MSILVHHRAISVLTSLLALCACSPCENDVLQSVPSGAGKTAIIFSRECGATTGFNTQLSIVDTGDQLPDEPGNALVLGGQKTIRAVRWKNARELAVEIVADAKTFAKHVRVHGISVSYVSVPQPGPVTQPE